MIYLLLAVFIWASSFVVGKIATSQIDPILTVQIRLIIAACMVSPFALHAYKQIPQGRHAQVWGLAFITLPLCFILQFVGLSHTSASSAVALLGLNPLLTVLVGIFFFKQTAHWLDFVLSIVAFFGILMMVYSSLGQGQVSLWGCLLVVAGSLSFIFGLFLSKKLMQTMDMMAYTRIILCMGAVACIPLSMIFVENWHIAWSGATVSSLLYLGVGCSWLAMLFWNKGVVQTSAVLSGLLLALEPVLGLLMTTIFLGERLSLLAWIGIVITLLSALISSLYPLYQSKKHA